MGDGSGSQRPGPEHWGIRPQWGVAASELCCRDQYDSGPGQKCDRPSRQAEAGVDSSETGVASGVEGAVAGGVPAAPEPEPTTRRSGKQPEATERSPNCLPSEIQDLRHLVGRSMSPGIHFRSQQREMKNRTAGTGPRPQVRMLHSLSPLEARADQQDHQIDDLKRLEFPGIGEVESLSLRACPARTMCLQAGRQAVAAAAGTCQPESRNVKSSARTRTNFEID